METKNINQALAEIENSLKKIDSARVQVEKVMKNGNELTLETRMLGQELKMIAGLIGDQTTSIISKFSKSLEDFDKRINTTNDKSQEALQNEVENFNKIATKIETFNNKSISEVKTHSIETIQKQVASSTKTINSITDNVKTETNTVIKQFSKSLEDFDKTISSVKEKSQGFIIVEVEKLKKVVAELETTGNKSINEVKLLSIGTIQEQEALISKTIDSMSIYIKEIQYLIEQISSMELPGRLNALDSSVKGIQNDIVDVQNELKRTEQNILENFKTHFDEIKNILKIKHKMDKKNNAILIISAVITISLLIGLILTKVI